VAPCMRWRSMPRRRERRAEIFTYMTFKMAETKLRRALIQILASSDAIETDAARANLFASIFERKGPQAKSSKPFSR
jgi:hypothetical protein